MKKVGFFLLLLCFLTACNSKEAATQKTSNSTSDKQTTEVSSSEEKLKVELVNHSLKGERGGSVVYEGNTDPGSKVWFGQDENKYVTADDQGKFKMEYAVPDMPPTTITVVVNASNNGTKGFHGSTIEIADKPSEPIIFAEEESYQAIFDSYSAKIREVAPGLVQEYEADSVAYSGDINKLAEISNSKIEKLAAVSTEGISKMADLMMKKSDDYSNYENWAGQLMDVYAQEATAITDAYLKSVQ